jgi:hypothetical protein
VTGSFRDGTLCDGSFCDGSFRDGTFCMLIEISSSKKRYEVAGRVPKLYTVSLHYFLLLLKDSKK